MNFISMNQRFFELVGDRFAQRRENIRRGAAKFVSLDYNTAPNLLPVPILFPRDAFDELAQAGAHFLRAQKSILQELIRSVGRQEVLRKLRLPAELDEFVDWKALLSGGPTFTRFDVVMAGHDRFMFCEANTGSSIGGGEEFEFCRLFMEEMGLPSALYQSSYSPYVDTGRVLSRYLAQGQFKRILILNWSTWVERVDVKFQTMKRAFAAACPGVPVTLTDEVAYQKEIDAGTAGPQDLVFRVFLFEDALDNLGFLRSLAGCGARVVSTYEYEITTSKLWFHILRDPEYQSLLSDAERASVEAHVPRTFHVTEANVEGLVASRDRYIFKPISSGSGRGIMIGADASAEQMKGHLRSQDLRQWIAQEMCEQPTLELPFNESLDRAPHTLVLGQYHIAGEVSGMFVRASRTSRVVSCSLGGAACHWSLNVSEQTLKTTERLLSTGSA